MRAVRFYDYGSADVLVVEDVPRPEPGDGELLVRVRATGVHPYDWKLRSGMLREFVPLQLPHTPGFDFAGVVVTTGPGIEGFPPGMEVYGTGRATYAEFATAKPASIARKPRNLTFVEAAAVPVGACTAWAAVGAAGVQSGQRVLVQGGAGGVGEFAVQLARYRGASVIATASAANADFVLSLGADEVVDYSSTPFEEVLSDLDAVIDTVGGDVLERSLRVVKPGGVVATIAGQPSAERAADLGIRAVHVQGKVTADLLTQLTGLIEDGALQVHVARVLPLELASEAQATGEARHGRGRLVLEV